MSETEKDKQKPVPSPDIKKWRDANWDIKYEVGTQGYRPGLKGD